MIRRPPRSTLDRSSAASDVYKRQTKELNPVDCAVQVLPPSVVAIMLFPPFPAAHPCVDEAKYTVLSVEAVSYTHLRAHETVLDLVCRLLLEKKKF